MCCLQVLGQKARGVCSWKEHERTLSLHSAQKGSAYPGGQRAVWKPRTCIRFLALLLPCGGALARRFNPLCPFLHVRNWRQAGIPRGAVKRTMLVCMREGAAGVRQSPAPSARWDFGSVHQSRRAGAEEPASCHPA